ncbi:acyl-CoA dehydrogenase [Ammoniphilus oxalaticus]|uniref:Acyl-CoA dehydrogenase n=1 Tax=Ammoniphilus oxalaticus TaxID=66863 RepID=A0A419SLM8_9BACL|nr:acyl-CoA dehydrogenase family protein [Ammoniphilus oxalaticus]RKD24980.1 acyl-CoA dehydrogenase [Ammoniphilus oxalaticus]
MSTAMNIDYFVRNQTEEKLVTLADSLAERFYERAAGYDLSEETSFPFQNFKELREAGYLKLTTPRCYGGDELSLYQLVLVQERLARGDGSTALAVGWHLGLIHHYRHINVWPHPLFEQLCRDVVEQGAMINHFSSERNTGSPTRGGRPETIARRTTSGWLLSGRKTYSTLIPILDRFVVTAFVEESEQIGHFYVKKQAGIEIDPTWNTLGMRATASHDVILDNVFVPDDAYVPTSPTWSSDGNGWLLHIPACYAGIAYAARDFALKYASKYQPNSLQTTISKLPHIQQRIAQIEQDLMISRTLLYSVADRWDRDPEHRTRLQPELGLAKKVMIDHTLRIIDNAMRIVGGASLSRDLPLERWYRDARAGLHNPPMEDAVDRLLAMRALAEFERDDNE